MKSPAVDLIRTMNVTCNYGTWNNYTNTLTANRKITSQQILDAFKISVTIGSIPSFTYTTNGHYRIEGFGGAATSGSFIISGGYANIAFIVASFSTLNTNLKYSLEFDISGVALQEIPTIENITLVAGETGCSYEQIYGPIATVQDMFDVCGITSDPETPDGTKALIFNEENSNAQLKKSEDVESNGMIYRFYLLDNPSQEYSDSQAIRFADLQTSSYSESSL